MPADTGAAYRQCGCARMLLRVLTKSFVVKGGLPPG